MLRLKDKLQNDCRHGVSLLFQNPNAVRFVTSFRLKLFDFLLTGRGMTKNKKLVIMFYICLANNFPFLL